MATCRFFLILLAASAAEGGVTGGTSLGIWSALVLAAYIVGLSYLARNESTRAPLRYWPCVLLTAPVVLALVVNQGWFQQRGFLLSVLYVLWTILCLRHAFWVLQPNIGRSVSGLLAGIVLIDFLAVGGGGTLAVAFIFSGLFVLALIFQRFIPAT